MENPSLVIRGHEWTEMVHSKWFLRELEFFPGRIFRKAARFEQCGGYFLLQTNSTQVLFRWFNRRNLIYGTESAWLKRKEWGKRTFIGGTAVLRNKFSHSSLCDRIRTALFSENKPTQWTFLSSNDEKPITTDEKVWWRRKKPKNGILDGARIFFASKIPWNKKFHQIRTAFSSMNKVMQVAIFELNSGKPISDRKRI